MIKRNALLFGNKVASVVQFLAWISQGKTALYVHPEYVAMDWKTFNKLKAKKKPQIIFDEIVELEKEQLFKDEKIPKVK